MTDLKRKSKKLKTTVGPAVMSEDYSEPEYSYRLKIALETEELDKLDMEVKDFNIGDIITAEVQMEVVGINISDSLEGKEYNCVDLQIQGLDIT